ncbi:MAG: hypothetical protein KatS3mg121_1327 [Gammaproteobacteria bacterium]|nr:MAG: hypothetical protein KatS3mg121_1327 [Gammaproteobacteria bacterium]
MSLGTLLGLFTLLLMLAFIAICLWAYSPRRKETYRAAAQLPLLDGEHDHE